MSDSSDGRLEIDWNGGTALLHVGAMSGTYPLKDLETWIGFYRQQGDLFPKARCTYAAKIKLLEQALTKRDTT